MRYAETDGGGEERRRVNCNQKRRQSQRDARDTFFDGEQCQADSSLPLGLKSAPFCSSSLKGTAFNLADVQIMQTISEPKVMVRKEWFLTAMAACLDVSDPLGGRGKC